MRKCNDLICPYHKPLTGDEEITVFPDPVPHEIDGILDYEPGSDPSEKFLPSKLEGIEKNPHNIPFSLTAQTAKNVGFVIKCEACDKPRLLHSKSKVKHDELRGVQRLIAKLNYVWGAAISEYMGTGADRDEKYLKTIFVRENLSCASKIEIPYYSVDNYAKICIHCGVKGTSRTLGNSIENYPKCIDYTGKPDIRRRKRKAVTENDLAKKKK